MSLILEALKKSEAERRLGQSPGLMTPMPTLVRRRTSPHGWLVAVVVIALSLVIAIGWMSRTRDRALPAVEVAASAPSSRTAIAGEESAAEPARTTAVAAEADQALAPSPRDATRPASESALRAVAPPARDAAPTPRDPEFDSVERESVAVDAAGSIPTSAAIEPAPAHAVSTAVPSAPDPETPSPSATSDAARSPAPQDPLGTGAPDLPRFDQLSAEERASLPPLKLSMHLFAEDASARFVLIDGQRYQDDDRLSPALRVVRIRRDGVELDFNGRRFLLPRP